MLDQFLERLAAVPDSTELCVAAAESSDNLVIHKCRGGSPPALIAMLARRARRPLLVVTSSLERAESLTDGLSFFGARPLIFPAFETLPFETTEPVLHIIAARNRGFQVFETTHSGFGPRVWRKKL